MSELFETVLTLSLFGFVITALLLILKPITVKRFPARWQYYVWLAVLVAMVVPVYRFIPEKEIQKISFAANNEITLQQAVPQTDNAASGNANPGESTSNDTDDFAIRKNIRESIAGRMGAFAALWLAGAGVYAAVVLISYIIYLLKKRKNSFLITDNQVLEETKKELNIKRNIKLKMSEDTGSPMLVGLVFPKIYIPAKSISDENMKMIFMHELTHYKRRDLAVKWFALLVNAIHWFNPLAYILCKNISEACEISCDMAVTKNMSDDDKKIYMKTILDLAQ